ncbi:unnamed protein product [Rotaria sp. Silwood2]|nr:unnamed protein product [Rotaria sp. Silwood2]CAF2578394.1 unnamed protein product [Rotaria sp. Silwood2]CAF2825383.1 unnamed protein product [Rotaria sp. Silwood2]CAF2986421.1 unnamed protein product [Rotaria sp. Silwood2]CAF3953302.1 unnamed protein product [Rotaria sp. Silwood2]
MPPKGKTAEEKQHQAHLNNHANQLNSNNERFHEKHEPEGWRENKTAMDFRARQLNPCDPIFQAPKK